MSLKSYDFALTSGRYQLKAAGDGFLVARALLNAVGDSDLDVGALGRASSRQRSRLIDRKCATDWRVSKRNLGN